MVNKLFKAAFWFFVVLSFTDVLFHACVSSDVTMAEAFLVCGTVGLVLPVRLGLSAHTTATFIVLLPLCGQAQRFTSTVIETNATLIAGGVGKLATNGWNCFLFYSQSGPIDAMFNRGTTNTIVQFAEGNAGSIGGLEYSGTNLWIQSYGGTGGVFKIHIREYLVSGEPPATIAVQSTNFFGDSDSRVGPMIKTPTGVFAFSYQNTPVEGPAGVFPETVNIAYKPFNGSWTNSSHKVGTETTSLTSDSYAAALHPDGSVWFFYKRDSFTIMDALRVVENGGGTYSVQTNSNFLTITTNSEDTVEGELPSLTALTDTNNGVIKVLYERENTVICNAVPFIKKAYMDVMNVASNSTKTFNRIDLYVERIDKLAYLLVGGNPSIFYHFMDCNGRTNQLYTSTYNGSSWSTPVFFDTTSTANSIGSSQLSPAVVYERNNGERVLITPDTSSIPRRIKIRNVRLRL